MTDQQQAGKQIEAELKTSGRSRMTIGSLGCDVNLFTDSGLEDYRSQLLSEIQEMIEKKVFITISDYTLEKLRVIRIDDLSSALERMKETHEGNV